ncbi:MAG: ABC transporter permease subunit [Ruthenibacterium sp.]
MISLPLFRREAKSNYKLLLIFMGVLTLYGSMIIAMFDPALGDSLAQMAQSMPQLFAAFGMLDVGATLVAFCANYLYGFLLVVLPLVFTVILSNRLVARYVDRGSMAYLLATPCTRRKLIATQIFVLCGSLALLFFYVTVLCLCVSAALFPNEMDVKSFILLNVGAYCLAVFLAGVCFFPSCVCNDSKTSTGIGAGICIAFVLLQMLSQVGEKFEVLRYATPLTLFNTDAILANEASALWHCGILLLFGLLLMVCGQVIFMRRDLPV